jgi:hypothetical protein
MIDFGFVDFIVGLVVAVLLFVGCILFMYFWNKEEKKQ